MHTAHVVPALAFAVAAASGCAGDQAAMASWADRELAKLIDPIEEHRKTFGCYPQHVLHG